MTDRYPETPGAKGPDGTSQDAAEAIKPCVSYLRRLAMRSLKPLPRGPQSAWIYNLEDSQDELDRQVSAACLFHGISPTSGC